MASGHSVRLDVGTHVRILSEQALGLDRGVAYIDSGPRPAAPDVSLEIRTPLGVVREIGTQFEVKAEGDAVRVRVREGEVSLETGADRLRVAAGIEISVDLDGSTTRRRLPSYAPEWDWLGQVTPMMDLEGRSLREFLDWIGRERGWQIRFESGSVAASASEIILNGSIEGLTLDEALQAVLPTTGTSFHVEEGILTVEAASGSVPVS
jgi:ferric-dicitrate binding protein FerR (iron transport regulator)